MSDYADAIEAYSRFEVILGTELLDGAYRWFDGRPVVRFETLERFRMAAEAENLADHVRYTRFGEVFWSDPDVVEWDGGQPCALLELSKQASGWSWMAGYQYQPHRGKRLKGHDLLTREAAIRAGLKAIWEAGW